MTEPLISDRAVEFDGTIIGYVKRLMAGDFHAWNERHSTIHATKEQAHAWLVERYVKAQEGDGDATL